MKCKLCNELPRIDFPNSAICILVPTSHHISPIEELLLSKHIVFNLSDNIFSIESMDLDYLVSLLDGMKLSELEKKDIKIMPYSSSKSNLLPLESLKHFKTLKYWSDLYASSDLLYVLKNSSLKILFHPIVHSASNKIYGYEALSRGVKSDGSIIRPDKLFAMAKNTDLLFFLDRLCRESIIKRASELNITKKLFINFIPTSIYDPAKCLKTTDEAIYKYKLDPRQVVFEVVETEYIEDYNHLSNILNYYRDKGYSTALDDIGSGYSNIDALKTLKTNYMKIDMNLVRDIDVNRQNQKTVGEYIDFAKSKDIYCLAEGVEKKSEYDYLLNLGVDFIQGYYFAKPSEIPIKKLDAKE